MSVPSAVRRRGGLLALAPAPAPTPTPAPSFPFASVSCGGGGGGSAHGSSSRPRTVRVRCCTLVSRTVRLEHDTISHSSSETASSPISQSRAHCRRRCRRGADTVCRHAGDVTSRGAGPAPRTEEARVRAADTHTRTRDPLEVAIHSHFREISLHTNTYTRYKAFHSFIYNSACNISLYITISRYVRDQDMTMERDLATSTSVTRISSVCGDFLRARCPLPTHVCNYRSSFS